MTGLEAILAGAQFTGALIAAVAALVAWRRRAQPGSLPLALLMLSVMAWGVSAGTKTLVGLEQQNTWKAMEILGAGVSSVLYLVFILEYARREKLIQRRILHPLWFVPIASAIVAYTNDSHFLFWSRPGQGPSLFLGFLLYYYILRLVATAILARAILRLSPTSRARAWVLTIGALAPWLGSIVSAVIAPAEQLSFGSLELHPLAYAFSGLVLGWGILHYRILEIIPLARDLVLENLRDAIITLDSQNRIVDLNPSAQSLLGIERKDAFGQILADVLPPFHPLRELILNSAVSQQVHIPLPFDCYYEVENIPVAHKRSQEGGWLVVLHDITERRRAHDAEHEQRILAESLTQTAEIITSSLELNEILRLILENVGRVVPHDAANISLIEGQYVRYTDTKGYEKHNVLPNTVQSLQFKYKEIPNLRQMILSKKPVVIPHTGQYTGWVKVPEAMWIQSYVGAPIIIKNKVVGFLSLDSATPCFFTEKHARRLAAFSVQAAIAIENARLFGKMQQSLNERRKAQQSLGRANKRLETKISEIEQLQAQLREQAIRDPLTGLYNRRYLDETLEREVARAKRDDLPIAILMLDIDHFKQVNDTYGHEAGDLLLKSLAGILLRESRRSDIACRFGGEEFCVIMPGVPMPVARQRAEAWRKSFAEFSLAYKHHTLRATLSIGIAIYPDHGNTGENILHIADGALYTAKQAGRNRVEIAPLPTV